MLHFDDSRRLFSSHEPPGRYDRSTGTTVYVLTLTADHRFEYRESYHTGGVSVSNQGTWWLDGDRLLLVPRQPTARLGRAGMRTRFVPVKWEQRLYLIDEHWMPAFCSTAAIKSEGALEEWNEDWNKYDFLKVPEGKSDAFSIESAYPPLSRNSRPRLPARYRTFYEHGPIRTRVIKVLPPIQQGRQQRVQGVEIPNTARRVLLDSGISARLKTGLLLEGGYFEPELIVTTVRPYEAEAVQVLIADDSPQPIRIDDEYSSGDSGFGGKPRDTGWDWPKWAIALHEVWNGSWPWSSVAS